MTPLEIRPLEQAGAEVFGSDISALTVGESNQLEAAFAAFGLLVFREQAISSTELVDFSRRWVPGAAAPAPLACVSDDRASNISGAWHALDTARTEPLTGQAVLFRGGSHELGHTRFASMYAAWDALASSTQRALEGLTGIHEHASQAQPVRQPLIIRHPRSGRPVPLLNPTSTIAIDGMADEPGLALLNELFEHGQREEFVEHVNWEPGTVVLWDARAQWQFDAEPASSAARFERVDIPGEPLAPAVRIDRNDPSLVQRAGATLAGGIITAAMHGIAEVIEPERARSDIEIVSEAPEEEPLLGLDFGDLPPLS